MAKEHACDLLDVLLQTYMFYVKEYIVVAEL